VSISRSGRSATREGVELDRQGPIWIIRINRPSHLNALDPESSSECLAYFREGVDDSSLRVVIVTGAGERSFCAGFDLSAMNYPAGNEDSAVGGSVKEGSASSGGEGGVSVGALTKDIYFPKPVIAAVNGLAYGGGLELMLACDLRIAVPHATFALPEVGLGLIAGGGGTVRLPSQIPWAIAAEVLMLGRVLSADEALDLGLINRIVEPDDLLPAAIDLAGELARRSPDALRYTKASMWRSRGMTIADALELEQGYSELVQRSAEAQQGVASFFEKRRAAEKPEAE